MKRFFVTAALAAVIGLGLAGKADAQYVQRYTTITPNGGVVIGNNYSNWGAYQANRTYISPFGAVNQRSYYGDVFGNRAGQSYGYNSYSGYGYNRGFYQPSPFLYPSSGFGYNYYRRW